MTYKERLEQLKASYPFEEWRTYYKRGLKQYCKINCVLAVKIMDTLLEDLAKAGLRAKPQIKIDLIEKAVIEFNALDSMTGQTFIETEERDDLGQLFERVAIKAKIDLEQFEYNDITYKVRTW